MRKFKTMRNMLSPIMQTSRPEKYFTAPPIREDKKKSGCLERAPGQGKDDNRYSVTRSSHLTMASITTIEMPHTTTKTPHVAEIEMFL